VYIRVISFGTNWWAMRSTDMSDPLCFRRRAAYFNAAALMCGRRLRHSAVFPGQVRFNTKSGFDPEFPGRAIGKTFLCSGPNQCGGRTHLLVERIEKTTHPDAYLVTLNSADHGSIQFDERGWRSSGVLPVSISLRGSKYEAMLLMGAADWVRADLGIWQMDQAGNRLTLSACEKEVRP
jgi:hypothetical protein